MTLQPPRRRTSNLRAARNSASPDHDDNNGKDDEDGDDGAHVSWMIPIVGKNERLEVSFEIKGSGEVDAEALNRFHGVHFGDEVETEDVPSLEEESVEETVVEESTEAEASDEETPKVTWREDVLLRVMKASDIKDRDAFIAHAVNFDHDDNGYLKKAELEDAAKAWNEANSEESSETEEGEEASEESTEEEASSEAEEATNDDSADEESGESEEKQCPICSIMCPKDAKTCSACSFAFI